MTETVEKRSSIGARRNPATAEAILDAAEALLREGNLSGFSIEAVARRARAGKPTIYRWWPNKTRLLLDVYQRQKAATEQIDTGTIEGDCVLFLETLLGTWEAGNGPMFRSIVAEAQSDEAAAAALRDYAAGRRAVTGKMFERARARGELAAEASPELAAEIIAAYAWARLLTGRLATSREELQPVVRQMLRGVMR